MINKINKKSTLREVLQVVGTELLREGFNSNIHVAATMGSIKDTDKVIITDMRFPNELKAVEDRQGITIRVNRFNTCNCGNSTDWKYDTIKDGSNRYCGVCGTKQTIKDEHESETSLDSAIFDYVIENDGELVDLVSKVREIMLKENLWQEKQ